MTSTDLHVPAGSSANSRYEVDIAPERAGWDYSSLRVLDLPPGGRHAFDTGDSEWIVLPLSGSCTVAVDGALPPASPVEIPQGAPSGRHPGEKPGGPPHGGAQRSEAFHLAGRESVFAGVTDFVYLPRDAHAFVASRAGGRFALAGARCTRRLPARYGPASVVPVELRGSGNCSRQVNNFGAAGVFECDKLIAVEVLTPGGNWSSFPPHKHDEDREGESRLEEIYYFEIADAAGNPGSAGLGYQRVSPSGSGKGTDILAEVRSGDAVLIPDGWHGPSMATPGYDMYYLNVMAGPGEERAWLICDHPDHAWVRSTWPDQQTDPRLPLYTAPTELPERSR